MKNEHSRAAKLPNISRTKKIVFSFAATALVLGVLELLLACFWVPPPLEDPYVGFSTSVPLLIAGDSMDEQGAIGPPLVSINPAKLVWFNNQSFPVTKAPGTFRIVCLGGSTTFGRPFNDSTSFCGWLRTMLPIVQPNQNWEVINAGGVSYASYRIARVMEEFAVYDVDLFVLYTGQNEFLEWRTYGELIENDGLHRKILTLAANTRLSQSIKSWIGRAGESTAGHAKQLMPGEVDEMLNHSIGPANYVRDAQWCRGVEEHFRLNLDRMKQIADSAGARLAVVIPASNLRDCAPFKADFRDDMDDATRQRLNQDLATAQEMVQDGAAVAAVELLEPILDSDASNALVHYCKGKALFELGRYPEAEECFQQAIDEDICCLRATTPIKQAIRNFAEQDSILTVDFESHFQRQLQLRSGHVCFGAESFLDHVHPTIDGHREIALAIMNAMVKSKLLPAVASASQIDQANEIIEQRLDLRAQAVAFRNLAKLTHWAGKFDEAVRHANDALRLLPDDLESRFILADCMYKAGKYDEAAEQYTRLFEIGDFDRAYQPYGELLALQGHNEAAKAYLLQAVFVSSGRRLASALESLGRLHRTLGEQSLADECFQNAAKLRQSP